MLRRHAGVRGLGQHAACMLYDDWGGATQLLVLKTLNPSSLQPLQPTTSLLLLLLRLTGRPSCLSTRTSSSRL